MGFPSALIGIDWGTSSLRAYLFDASGRVIDRRAGAWGVAQVPARDFASVLARAVGDWALASPSAPLLASGMIGSTLGWRDAGYVDVPAPVAALVAGLAPVAYDAQSGLPAGRLAIVPGVRAPGALPDLMRGEETQVIGASAGNGAFEDGLCVLPGTHSKWVRVDAGRITSVSTWMTGELFALLRADSVFGRAARGHDAAAPDEVDAAFDAGVRTARDHGMSGGVAPLLFSVRTRMLAGDFSPAAAFDYLSGLLVGDELRAALARTGTANAAALVPRLVGDPVLCDRYRTAFAAFGIDALQADADAAAMGLWRIALAAGLVDA